MEGLFHFSFSATICDWWKQIYLTVHSTVAIHGCEVSHGVVLSLDLDSKHLQTWTWCDAALCVSSAEINCRIQGKLSALWHCDEAPLWLSLVPLWSPVSQWPVLLPTSDTTKDSLHPAAAGLATHHTPLVKIAVLEKSVKDNGVTPCRACVVNLGTVHRIARCCSNWSQITHKENKLLVNASIHWIHGILKRAKPKVTVGNCGDLTSSKLYAWIGTTILIFWPQAKYLILTKYL